MFENRVLRRTLGPRRDEETGKWRKPYNEKLHDLCSSPNTIRVMKSRRMGWRGHVTHNGGQKGCIQAYGGKPMGKRPLGRPKLGWEDNIKIDLK
jgi:hypothetical protein